MPARSPVNPATSYSPSDRNTSAEASLTEPNTASNLTDPDTRIEQRSEGDVLPTHDPPSTDAHPGYGDGFHIEESTLETRMHARAVIFDDVTPVPSSAECFESEGGEVSGKSVYSDDARKGLGGRISRRMRILKENFEKSVWKGGCIASRWKYGSVKSGERSKTSSICVQCNLL